MLKSFWGDQLGNAPCIHTCSRIYYVLHKWIHLWFFDIHWECVWWFEWNINWFVKI
jgi:hypothetical protein